jgi:hypothetical protein
MSSMSNKYYAVFFNEKMTYAITRGGSRKSMRGWRFVRGEAVMVKKWFSKEYNLFVFFVPAEKK